MSDVFGKQNELDELAEDTLQKLWPLGSGRPLPNAKYQK